MVKKNNEGAKVILLTGASAGIGLAIARKLLKTDFKLVLTARENSISRFRELGITENERILIRPLDVRDYQQQNNLIREIEKKWNGVDILINNAGITYSSVVEHMTPDDEQQQLAVNYLGPMNLIRLVLPGMRKKRAGRIINISSVSGMMAMPTMASYSASKFALEGASESLWYEMRPWGIKVTLIEPGFVHSNSFKNVIFTDEGRKSLKNADSDYHPYYANMGKFIERMMNSAISTPESIADLTLKTIRASYPRLRITASPDARFFYFLRRLSPRFIYHHLLYYFLPGIFQWGRERTQETTLKMEFKEKIEKEVREEIDLL